MLHRLRGECGSTLLEFVLVIIFFLTMLFGIAGFGMALYAYHFVSNAAREATRYAAVRGSTCTSDNSCVVDANPGNTVVQDYVATIVPPGIDNTKVTTSPLWPVQVNGPTICGTTLNAPGCVVQVQVTYNFNFIFPLISSATLPLSSTSQMVIVH